MPPTILIVEDNLPMRAMLEMLLQLWAYPAYSVSRADEALPFIERGEADVVIADLNLPGRSGLDLVMEVHARFPSIGLVLMTGEALGGPAAVWAETCGVPLLLKPFAPEALEGVLRRYAERARP